MRMLKSILFFKIITAVREKMCAGYETLDIYRPCGT